ncbi:hypothetical protein CKO27_17300 [Thiocystis violacea]|nr:hypothetical protein [Thiocystis violacea]
MTIMKGIMSKQGAQAAALLMTLALASGSGWALEKATDLEDLTSKDLDDGQREMAKRGYELLQPAGEHGGPEYWWNPSRKRCVFLKTDGRKVGVLKSAGEKDCDYYIKKGRGNLFVETNAQAPTK